MGSDPSFGFPRFLWLLVALFFNGSFRVRFGFRVPSCFVFGVLRIARTLGQGFLFGSGLAVHASWPLLMLRFVFFRGSSFGAVPRFRALFLVGLLAEPLAAFFGYFVLARIRSKASAVLVADQSLSGSSSASARISQ